MSYLYRTVEKMENTVDFLPTAMRTRRTAKRFSPKRLGAIARRKRSRSIR
jgi:transposase-like protein